MGAIEPVEITAGRLHLRPWQPVDAPAVLGAFGDPLVARWYGDPRPADPAAAREWVARHGDWSGGGRAGFAVLDATSGALLGGVLLRGIDLDQGNARLGYWTVAAARGRGVATQAVETVTRWGFGALGLERIRLVHAVENVASCRVAEKAGYRWEGTLRQGFRYSDGRRHDEHLHARLRTD